MARQFMQVVDGPLSVRSEPSTSAKRLGEVATGVIIETVPGADISAEGFVWVQHHFGWSAERSIDEGAVFMQPVAESFASSDSTAVLLGPLRADGARDGASVPYYFQVVEGPLAIRAEARTSAPRLGALALHSVIAVDPSTRTLADGFIWWRHARGWSAAGNDAGTVVYLERIGTPANGDLMQAQSVLPAQDAPPVELPVLEAAQTTARFFKVVMGPVTVRERPDVTSRKLGAIPDGVTLEVVPSSRRINGDYIYWQHSGGWSAEGKVDGSETFMIPVDEGAVKVEVPAPEHPAFTPEDFRFLKVIDGPVSIRAKPDPSSEKLGEIANEMVIEVVAGSRTVAGGYVYYRHSSGWSAMGAASGGAPFMIPVDVMLPDVIVTLPQIPVGVFQVIDGPISIRTAPDPAAEKIGELLVNATIEIDRDSMTEVGGFIWWRHHLGWSVERRADNSKVFMMRVAVMLNPPLPEPGFWEDGTPIRYFEVGETPVSIRTEPDPASGRVGTLFSGEQIEVDPASRLVRGGLVWWRHAQGWSAEKPIAGASPFLVPIRELTRPPSTGGFNPLPIFARHPFNMSDTQWIQYFGNTQFAYNLRRQGKFWYNYCQGLHGGFDYGCNRALPIMAGVHGRVIDVRYGTRSYAPNFTRVRVGPFMVIYGHIASPVPFSAGDEVTPDTVVGVIDAGGQNHVHIEVRYRNQIVNPLLLLPDDLHREITARWRDFPKHFYSDPMWAQWQTPFDQPILELQQKGREIIVGPHGGR